MFPIDTWNRVRELGEFHLLKKTVLQTLAQEKNPKKLRSHIFAKDPINLKKAGPGSISRIARQTSQCP